VAEHTFRQDLGQSNDVAVHGAADLFQALLKPRDGLIKSLSQRLDGLGDFARGRLASLLADRAFLNLGLFGDLRVCLDDINTVRAPAKVLRSCG
jgi:hypothetical protein